MAWGGLTILMTFVVHQYVEAAVFLIPAQVLSGITFLLTAVIFADFSLSFKAALDLRDILIKLEDAKIELGHLQMRMDVLIALTTEELEKKFEEYRNDMRERKEIMTELRRWRTDLIAGMEKQLKKTFLANPTMHSAVHAAALEALKNYVTGANIKSNLNKEEQGENPSKE